MKTKKLIAGAIAVATMATMATSAIVTAADAVTLKVSNTQAKAGEEFTLTVDLADIPTGGMNACEFGIEFDSSIVSVTGVTKGSMVADVPETESAISDPLTTFVEEDCINVIYGVATVDSTYYLNGEGTFLTITGTVNSTASAGDVADFKVVAGPRNDSMYFGLMDESDAVTNYTPTITDGYVEVIGEGTVAPTEEETTEPVVEETTEPGGGATEDIPNGTLYGDVDLSGKVGVNDAVTLNLHLLDKDANPLVDEAKANADVCRDNSIDNLDSAMLINAVAEIIAPDELGKVAE